MSKVTVFGEGVRVRIFVLILTLKNTQMGQKRLLPHCDKLPVITRKKTIRKRLGKIPAMTNTVCDRGVFWQD